MPDLLAQLQTAVLDFFDFLIAVTGFVHRSTCGIDALLIAAGAGMASGRVRGGAGRYYQRIKTGVQGLVKR